MSDRELVTLTVEGVDVSVPKGTTILEAAKQAGIVIPHYCYHPSLPVAGVCRMCLVEVEGAPKLQIGCFTTVAEGQQVKVYSDEAKRARESVLEFLLINHPLDCPICDQAGECELQDYVFQEGRARTRYTPTYAKRFNPVEDFGGDVLYVPNRCILCTRCVRFMDHVAEDSVLNVSERGDRAYIGVHVGRGLDHQWAGNVVDLCPVGSLISKDFLHKARAWELDKTPGICTGCSQGCNVNIDSRSNLVVRLRPRVNLDVNSYFMCDYGRETYRNLNRGDRMEAPLVQEHGGLIATDWDHALERVAQIIQGSRGHAVALVSPRLSTEALFLVRALLDDFDVTAAFRVDRVDGEVPLVGVPNLALRGERAPNVAGATVIGYTEGVDAAIEALPQAALAIVVEDGLDGVDAAVLRDIPNFVYLGTSLPAAAREAAVALPITNPVEEDGTFVNRDDRVQRYLQAKAGPGMARPAWWVAGEVLTELGRGESVDTAAEAFERMAESVSAFRGLTYETLEYRGATIERAAVAGVAP